MGKMQRQHVNKLASVGLAHIVSGLHALCLGPSSADTSSTLENVVWFTPRKVVTSRAQDKALAVIVRLCFGLTLRYLLALFPACPHDI